MERIFVHKMFVGANGIDAKHGATAFHPEEVALSRIMVGQTREKVVVVDHTKLGLLATHLFCPIESVKCLIAGSGATEEMLAGFIERGIDANKV